ncbi:MAG TPA: hypothetical protein VEK82_06230 [Stellaceae bacterium]|nr:hypothetical protein [Stellaceae bacterium]
MTLKHLLDRRAAEREEISRNFAECADAADQPNSTAGAMFSACASATMVSNDGAVSLRDRQQLQPPPHSEKGLA